VEPDVNVWEDGKGAFFVRFLPSSSSVVGGLLLEPSEDDDDEENLHVYVYCDAATGNGFFICVILLDFRLFDTRSFVIFPTINFDIFD